METKWKEYRQAVDHNDKCSQKHFPEVAQEHGTKSPEYEAALIESREWLDFLTFRHRIFETSQPAS